MSHPTTVRFDDGEYAELERLAERRGISVSELIREVVREAYLEDEGSESTEKLLAYISSHQTDGEPSIDDVEKEIDEALSDAARRQ